MQQTDSGMRTQAFPRRVYAGFFARLAAYLIDLIVVGVIHLAARFAMFLSFGVFFDENPLDWTFLFQYSIRDALLYAAGAAYFVLCTYYAGATLGKRALNLRVISADGGKLSFFDVLYRETVGRFLAAFVLGIGYIIAGFTQEKKGLHDMLADTRVIYAAGGAYRDGGDWQRKTSEPERAAAPEQAAVSGQEPSRQESATQPQSEQPPRQETRDMQQNGQEAPRDAGQTERPAQNMSRQEAPRQEAPHTPQRESTPQETRIVQTRPAPPPPQTFREKGRTRTGTLYDRYQHVNIDSQDRSASEDKEQK